MTFLGRHRKRLAHKKSPRFALGAALFVLGCGGGGEALAPEAPAFPSEAELSQALPPKAAAPAQPPPVEAPKPPAPPPEEPVPEHLGTPASSRAAAPAWWLSHDEPSYAPAPPGEISLFEAAAEPHGGDDPAALACAFNIGHFREDTFFTSAQAAADMVIHARFGKKDPRPEHVTFNGWDNNAAVFVVPLAVLQPGDALSLRIDDANVFSPDTIDRVKAVYQGSYPLKLRGRITKGECRPVGRALIEASARATKAQFDNEIEAFAKGKVYLSSSSMGHSTERVYGAARSLAGLVGWDDPRVKVRLQRVEDIKAAQTAALGREVEATLKGLSAGPVLLADGMVALTYEPLRCGDDVVKKYKRYTRSAEDSQAFRKSPCVLVLSVENRTKVAIEIDRFSSAIGPAEDLMLVGPKGDRYALELAAELTAKGLRAFPRNGEKKIAPGKTIQVAALLLNHSGSEPPAPPPATPFLLRSIYGSSHSPVDAATPARFAGTVEMRGTAFACDAAATARYEALKSVWVRDIKGPTCVLDAEVRNIGTVPWMVYTSGTSLGPIHGLALLTRKDQGLRLTTLELDGKPGSGRVELAPGASLPMTFVGEKDELPAPTPALTDLVLHASFSQTLGFARIE